MRKYFMIYLIGSTLFSSTAFAMQEDDQDMRRRIQMERQRRFEAGDPDYRSVTARDVRNRDFFESERQEARRIEQRRRENANETLRTLRNIHENTWTIPIVGLVTLAIYEVAKCCNTANNI